MEPATISLAATTIHLLAPYLKDVVEAGAKSLGTEAAKSAFAKAGAVWGLVKSKLQGKPEASQALAKLETSPEDKTAQGVIEAQLKQALEADTSFADQLSQLLKEVAATKANVSFVNNIQGEVQKLVQIGTVIGDVNL